MYVPAKLTLALLLVGLVGTLSASAGTSTPQESAAPQSSNAQETSPEPSPDASGVYRPGHGVSDPKLIYSVNPEYTDKARRKKLGGVCIVGMVVDVNGVPQDVHVVRSIESSVDPKLRSAAVSLDENAVKTAKQYRFKPATYKGEPVPVELKVEISYRIY